VTMDGVNNLASKFHVGMIPCQIVSGLRTSMILQYG
jgi:hypothetical protein